MHTGGKAGVKNQSQPLVPTPPLHMYFYFKSCLVQQLPVASRKQQKEQENPQGNLVVLWGTEGGKENTVWDFYLLVI